MFAEEALAEVERFSLVIRSITAITTKSKAVYPVNVAKGFFYAFAGGGVVEHNFACTNVALLVQLPKNGCAGPVFAGAYAVLCNCLRRCLQPETSDKVLHKMVVLVIGKTAVYIRRRNKAGLHGFVGRRFVSFSVVMLSPVNAWVRVAPCFAKKLTWGKMVTAFVLPVTPARMRGQLLAGLCIYVPRKTVAVVTGRAPVARRGSGVRLQDIHEC